LDGELEGKRVLGKPRSNWDDNIKTDLRVLKRGFVWLRVGAIGGIL